MKDIPIIFSAPMIQALLAGRKTQTRRLASSPLAKVQPGDRLWVRETFEIQGRYTDGVRVVYEASRSCGGSESIDVVPLPAGARVPVCPGKLRPSIHMPRWASRITLVVEQVRVQPLQDISQADCLAEGAPIDANFHDSSADKSSPPMVRLNNWTWETPRAWYHRLWDELHGAGAWDTNPFVVALTFRVVRSNIDALMQEAA